MRLTIAFVIAQVCALAQSSSVCPRFPAGSAVTLPQDLFSANGALQVNLTYQTMVDENGNTLFCFLTASGVQSPTLHVNPGDRLQITLKNKVPTPTDPMAGMTMTMSGSPSSTCGAITMTASSVNIHYHGTNTPPTCHQDEVIHTMINSGETFEYDVQFPLDEPPGLYWYHPHIHGISEAAVLGGASGALIVEGIQNVNTEVAGLPQQVLVIRDNLVPGNPAAGGNVPSWDLSVNYIPVAYPNYQPAVIQMKPLEKLWRMLNASADTIIDLQLQYEGTPQPLRVVALDGVPTGSQDGTSTGKSITQTDILLAPAARAEFIVTGPVTGDVNALLMTLNVDTGPDGDNDPTGPLAAIETSADAPAPVQSVPQATAPPQVGRFAALDREKPSAKRKLYFSEVLSDPTDPNSPTNFLSRWMGRLRRCSIRVIRRPS